MANLEHQMKMRDREMVPRILVRAMFALMAFSLALTTYAVVTDRPKVGQLALAPAAEVLPVTFEALDEGYLLKGPSGEILAASAAERSGFIAVIGRLVDRERARRSIAGNPPVDVVLRENGGVGLSDPATGFEVELVGYGADNVAAFARLFD